jgi:thymidylate synthase (FAD)
MHKQKQMKSDNYHENAIPCLDKGFIRLVDFMGGDEAIVQAARVSYGKGTKMVSQDRGLIRYLMRHRHTTPLEMVEFKFHCKMPIFVARQWVRHRTANINEYSLRYSEARDEFYIPELDQIHYQSSINKQGRAGEDVPEGLKEKIRTYFQELSSKSYQVYEELNEAGIARELARAILPVNLYTEWYWKNDLHNIMHFLFLRMDDHAQYEIRVYAKAMATIVKEKTPIAYEAFEDYVINGWRFSGIEREVFTRNIPNRIFSDIIEDVIYTITFSLNEKKTRPIKKLWEMYKKEGGKDILSNFELKWNSSGFNSENIRELKEYRDKIENLLVQSSR